MTANRRLLRALSEAADALGDVPTEHGKGCSCILCHEHEGLSFVLRVLGGTAFASVPPRDWPRKARRKSTT